MRETRHLQIELGLISALVIHLWNSLILSRDWTGANRGDYSWSSTRCAVSICPMEIIAVELLFALIKQFARIAPMTILPFLPFPSPFSNGSHCVMSIYLNGKRKPNEPLSMELRCCSSISNSRTSLPPLSPFVLAAHMMQIFDLTIRRKYNNLAEHAKVSPSQSPSPSSLHSQWVVSNACHIQPAWHWLPQRATGNALHKMLICRSSDNRRNASWGSDGGRDCGGNGDGNGDCSSTRWLNHSAELCNVRELMRTTNVKVKWCKRCIPCNWSGYSMKSYRKLLAIVVRY